MTSIKINGKSDYISRKEVVHATKWMIEHLLGSRLARNLHIDINIKRLKNLRGDCIWIGNNHKPRRFKINISSRLRFETFLTTLAHELVHVKQYVKGELKDYIRYPGLCKWNGKQIYYGEHDYYTHPTFPWEIEAYGHQSSIYCKYLIDNDKVPINT